MDTMKPDETGLLPQTTLDLLMRRDITPVPVTVPSGYKIRIGDVYENWRTHHLNNQKMVYVVTAIKHDRTNESPDATGIVVIYDPLYPGGEGGSRTLEDFFVNVKRSAGEKRETDPAYDGPRFIYRGRVTDDQLSLHHSCVIARCYSKDR